MARTIEVPVTVRIPFQAKARIKLGWLLARLGLESLMVRTMNRLPYDVRIGKGATVRRYVEIDWEE